MTLNSSKSMIIAERRAAVASLRRRGLSQREIVRELERRGKLNPETGMAWAVGTINTDVRAMERQWQVEAAANVAIHKARQLARLEEHYRQAWENGDLREVRENIKTTMALLGTEAPRRQEIAGPDGGPIEHEHRGQVHGSIEHVAAVFATLAAVGAVELPTEPGSGDAEDDEVHPA